MLKTSLTGIFSNAQFMTVKGISALKKAIRLPFCDGRGDVDDETEDVLRGGFVLW